MYDDLDRPPLHLAALRGALVTEGGFWTQLQLVEQTASTNADVLAAARDGVAEGLVVVAESQTAGRGRLGRTWSAPKGSGLTFSVLLRPDAVPVSQWGWLPLLTGVAVVSAVRQVAEAEAALKWPNDVLLDDRKLGGILAERQDDAVAVGIGVNVSLRPDELPVPTATSLAIAGATSADRAPLLRAVLRNLATGYTDWRESGGDAERSGLRSAYLSVCSTIGRDVRVELPAGGTELTGTATGIDSAGRLIVSGQAVAAGDVVHVR